MKSVGKNPPPEINVMLIFKELNNLTPETFSSDSIIILNTE